MVNRTTRKIVERTLMEIDKIAEIYYKGPKSYDMPKELFCKLSYEKMAICELKVWIMRNQGIMSPILTIEKFRKTMESNCTNCTDLEKRYIYIIYTDVATNVLDHLL